MGIRGLRSFLTRNCPSTVRCRDIVMITSTNRKKTSKSATIVVDAPTCCFALFGKMGMHCGGQFTDFKAIVQQFVDAFRQKNIKLVFFFDGLVPDKALKRWHTKRTKDVKSMQTVLDEIKTGKFEETLTLHWVIIFFRLTLKALYKDDPLVEVYTAIENTRTLIIAQYATDNNCVAILSDDTVFVIYDTVPVMSCRKFNINNMTTQISNRNEICRELQINKDHFKILASLTDYDDYGLDYYPFYTFICNGRYSRRIPNMPPFGFIIKYIRDFGSCSYQKIVNEIAKEVKVYGNAALANHFRENVKDFEMKRRNTSYYKPNVEDDHTPEFTNCEAVVNYFTKKVITSDIFTMALEVMTNGRVLIWTTPLQDENDSSLIGHVELFRPIRKKLYEFIVFSPEIEKRDISEAWLDLDCNLKVEPVDLILEPPSESSLTELWKQLPEIDVRMNVLLRCFGFTSNDCREFFINIPTKMQPMAIVLRYMFKHPKMNISDWEITSFIVQAIVSIADNQSNYNEKMFESLDPRACHLAGLFIDGIIMYLNVALCCCFDLQSFMPWNYFDGTKFQHFYQKMKLGSTATQLLSENDQDVESLKEKLLNFITS